MGRDFTFTSPYAQVVCPACVRHQGSTTAKAIQRDTDHVALWHSELAIAVDDHTTREAAFAAQLAAVRADHAKQVQQLRVEINDLQAVLRTGLDGAPPPTVERWWVSEQLADADESARHAYRSRDHAYRTLWFVVRLHHDDDNRDRHCSCGKRTAQCHEFKAIANIVPTLRRWEEKQIERLRDDLDHGLPDEHPEVLRLRRPRHRWAS